MGHLVCMQIRPLSEMKCSKLNWNHEALGGWFLDQETSATGYTINYERRGFVLNNNIEFRSLLGWIQCVARACDSQCDCFFSAYISGKKCTKFFSKFSRKNLVTAEIERRKGPNNICLNLHWLRHMLRKKYHGLEWNGPYLPTNENGECSSS